MSRFEPFPVLRTERLLLRRLGVEDVDAVFALRSDPAVMRYLGRDPFRTRAEAEQRVADERSALERGEGIKWGLDLDGRLVGTAGFWRFDLPHQTAEIGYELASDLWGRGLVVEALLPILRHGFDGLALHRVEARIDPANTASARVLEKLGFVREGLLRESYLYAGAWTDTGLYGLLARDLRS